MRSLLKQKSKKGDIPVTILVIGVIVICIAAILSFSFASSRFGNSFSGIGVVEKATLIKEKADFYENKLGFDREEVNEFLDIETRGEHGRHINLTSSRIEVIYRLPG